MKLFAAKVKRRKGYEILKIQAENVTKAREQIREQIGKNHYGLVIREVDVFKKRWADGHANKGDFQPTVLPIYKIYRKTRARVLEPTSKHI